MEKWISNSRAVLQTIAEDKWAKDLKELNLDRDKLLIKRALGLLWCVESDSIVAPVTLLAKMMQQELCRRSCDWNDAIPL